MVQRKILCYGDSNTYGFDPRDFFGGRYDADSRWCDLLAKKTGWQVINCGENGRTIPRNDWEFRELGRLLSRNGPLDWIILMLGTNDVLQGCQGIENSMEELLACIRQNWPEMKLLLLTPPTAALPEPEWQEKLRMLAESYRKLAMQQGISYLNTQEWNLPLAYDGVHLSEEGHRVFADALARFFCEKE